MTDENQGRELAPREPGDVEATDSAITPAPDAEHRAVERFSAGPRAHSVGLTEERSAQIVRQSGSARNVVFLAVLLIALFIPVYWFYETGIPSLNDQPKLYKALTDDRQPGSGHLNPIYIDDVLTVGGRFVCGDPERPLAIWRQPDGPLNYRQIEELTAWLTASSDVSFLHEEGGHGGGHGDGGDAVLVRGWRDPDWEPEPGATPPPACWRAPNGLTAAGPDDGGTVDGSALTPGTAEAPRLIEIIATGSLTFTTADGVPLAAIPVVEGETIMFEVANDSGLEHNFYIGSEEELMVPNGTTATGIPTWTGGTESLEYTVGSDESLQFACTVPGHYGPMHGDIMLTS